MEDVEPSWSENGKEWKITPLRATFRLPPPNRSRAHRTGMNTHSPLCSGPVGGARAAATAAETSWRMSARTATSVIVPPLDAGPAVAVSDGGGGSLSAMVRRKMRKPASVLSRCACVPAATCQCNWPCHVACELRMIALPRGVACGRCTCLLSQACTPPTCNPAGLLAGHTHMPYINYV